MTIGTPQTAQDLERQLAAARERLVEIPGELAEAEAERDRLHGGWLASKELVEEAGRVLFGVGERVKLGNEEIIVRGVGPMLRDQPGAEEAHRRSRQAQAGLELAREEEGTALLAYQKANRRCHDLSEETNTLQDHVSVWERQVAAMRQHHEERGAELAEARGWLDRLRARVVGAGA